MGLDMPCKPWTGKTQSGRGYGYLYVDGRRWYAHRWVFFSHHGWLPAVVRHRCDNECCVEITHLVGGTQAENLQDMFDRGRGARARGERAPTAKLTEADVMAIRASSDSTAALARHHQVDWHTIDKARKRQNWRHLQEDPDGS